MNDWRSLAACANMADPSYRDSDPFFPEGSRGAGYGPKRYVEAKAICSACQVRPQCLADALDAETIRTPYRWGVWGGTNADERKALTRRTA